MELIAAALAGLLTGHLVDLLWGRFYTGEQVMARLYRCAYCRSPMRPVYALPFAAAILWDDGDCPQCGQPLPLRSIFLPGAAAVLFLISYAAFDGRLGAALLGGVFATVFLVLAMTDLETRLLPNRIVYPGILLAIAFSWAWPDATVIQIIGGGLVGILMAAIMLLVSIPFGPGAFGMGDVKMIVLIGFVLGVPAVLVALFLGTIAGGLAAAFLWLTGRKSRKDYIAHGPFLSLGALIGLFWGNEIWDAYTA
jgi:prepilin signal peptidase PulO-like enzyme (type II secretory pathway)